MEELNVSSKNRVVKKSVVTLGLNANRELLNSPATPNARVDKRMMKFSPSTPQNYVRKFSFSNIDEDSSTIGTGLKIYEDFSCGGVKIYKDLSWGGVINPAQEVEGLGNKHTQSPGVDISEDSSQGEVLRPSAEGSDVSAKINEHWMSSGGREFMNGSRGRSTTLSSLDMKMMKNSGTECKDDKKTPNAKRRKGVRHHSSPGLNGQINIKKFLLKRNQESVLKRSTESYNDVKTQAFTSEVSKVASNCDSEGAGEGCQSIGPELCVDE